MFKDLLYTIYIIIMLFVLVMFIGLATGNMRHEKMIVSLQLEMAELQQYNRGADNYHIQYTDGVQWVECITKPMLEARK